MRPTVPRRLTASVLALAVLGLAGSVARAQDPKARALLVGVNEVDWEKYDGKLPDRYGSGGKIPRLASPESDAKDLAQMLRLRGFREPQAVLGREATVQRVTGELNQAVDQLKPGDLFVLFFAGHLSQTKATGTGEPDGLDESFCCYDGPLKDKDLCARLAAVREGVRVVFLADCSHGSGLIDPGLLARTGDRRVKADLIAITSCRENEVAVETPFNGMLVGSMKRVLPVSETKVRTLPEFRGNYRDFFEAVKKAMPAAGRKQTPWYAAAGPNAEAFEAQLPFTLRP